MALFLPKKTKLEDTFSLKLYWPEEQGEDEEVGRRRIDLVEEDAPTLQVGRKFQFFKSEIILRYLSASSYQVK